MSNPINDYLHLKEAAKYPPKFGTSRLGTMFAGAGQKVLEEVPKGIGAGMAAAGIGAAGAAVNKIVDVVMKRREFREMMDHNPHLQDAHAQDPKRFNQLYSTLRTFNPAFAGDPIVSGSYMDRMWNNPQGAGGAGL